MRIAYVTETFPPEINGVALTAARTLAYLRNVGHSVQLIRPRQRGEDPRDSADEWRSFGGPIPMYPDLRYGLARAASLRRRWRRGPLPDLVHATTPGPLGWAALAAARAEGLPCTADFRTNFHAYSRHYGLAWMEPLLLAYLRRLHAMADCNFVPTRALAAQLAAQGFERLQGSAAASTACAFRRRGVMNICVRPGAPGGAIRCCCMSAGWPPRRTCSSRSIPMKRCAAATPACAW